MNPVVHFEMPYQDAERVAQFYQSVFGWQTKKFGEEMGNYILATTTETDENMMVKKPGTINGGFFPKEQDPKEPHSSRLVIQVPDIDKAIQKVKEAGGRVEDEPMDIPGVGRYVFFTDTEGTLVSMLQPALGKE